MTSNDILRRIRYIFDFDDNKMMALFALAGHQANRAEISAWLKKDDDPAFQVCSDEMLATFLNGLITDKRGKREGPQPVPEKRLTNNMVFMKLKIALDLKAEDILGMLNAANFEMSKHELSALFRKAGHKHYRACKDQCLRSFLKGLQFKYRGKPEPTPDHKKPDNKVADHKKPNGKSSDNHKPTQQHDDDAGPDRHGIWSTKFKK